MIIYTVPIREEELSIASCERKQPNSIYTCRNYEELALLMILQMVNLNTQ